MTTNLHVYNYYWIIKKLSYCNVFHVLLTFYITLSKKPVSVIELFCSVILTLFFCCPWRQTLRDPCYFYSTNISTRDNMWIIVLDLVFYTWYLTLDVMWNRTVSCFCRMVRILAWMKIIVFKIMSTGAECRRIYKVFQLQFSAQSVR